MGDDLVKEHLFRYRGYVSDSITKDVIRNRLLSELFHALQGKVWFSPLSAQNDPFDTNPHFIESPQWQLDRIMKRFRNKHGSLASLTGIDLRERGRQAGLTTKQMKANAKRGGASFARDAARSLRLGHRQNNSICCFTESAENVLMWSYYSASHRSYCLRFSCPESDLTLARKVIAKVKYVSKRPAITTVNILRIVIEQSRPGTFEVSDAEKDAFTDAFILTKSDSWKHEVEWRALQRPGMPQGYYSIWPYRLSGVVFGCKADRQIISEVVDALGSSVELMRAKIQKESYDLKVAPFSFGAV